MKKILVLALPAMLVASCGDSGSSIRAWPDDAAASVDETDTAPGTPDVPSKLDIAPTPSDVPFSTETPPPEPIDSPAQGIDGPAGPTDAETRTLRSPDGRTWTVIMVDACLFGSNPSTTVCPATYGEGLAKVRAVDGGSSFYGTKAGRCSEGAYVYFPYFSTSSIGCYYDATSQTLVASAQYEDTIIECGDGTASHAMVHGANPTCTNVTWEAGK